MGLGPTTTKSTVRYWAFPQLPTAQEHVKLASAASPNLIGIWLALPARPCRLLSLPFLPCSALSSRAFRAKSGNKTETSCGREPANSQRRRCPEPTTHPGSSGKGELAPDRPSLWPRRAMAFTQEPQTDPRCLAEVHLCLPRPQTSTSRRQESRAPGVQRLRGPRQEAQRPQTRGRAARGACAVVCPPRPPDLPATARGRRRMRRLARTASPELF